MKQSEKDAQIAIHQLLETLHIVHTDGYYNDKEALLQTLRRCGVNEEDIAYHLR